MTKHDRLVAELVEQGAETKNFKARVSASAIASHPEDERDESIAEIMDAFKLIPDAFTIDADELEVTVYEVEVTSPVTEKKMAAYCRLWCGLDAAGWDLRLVIIGRFRQRHEVDMFEQTFSRKAA